MMEFLFRADANPVMGTGHVMRCLALAEALQSMGHQCHFAVSELTPSLERRLARASMAVHHIVPGFDDSSISTRALAVALKASAVIVDGYHFSDDWRRSLRDLSVPILGFADRPESPPLHADLVVDAACDPRLMSGLDPSVEWLLGADYVLLRRELVEAARLPLLDIAERRSILVTFGGTDPAALTLPVALALAESLPAETPLDIVIGAGVPDGGAVAAKLDSRFRVHRDPPAMGGLMRDAGLAVSAAGGTIGELAALGVPSVVVIIADNQVEGAGAAASAGWCAAIDARRVDAVRSIAAAAVELWQDPAERARRAALARQTVDPNGAERIAARLIARAVA
jgi:UDP-2,4-diacetamido-2,4,6-trideoxy-beta-L-altropyranose hydrolase